MCHPLRIHFRSSTCSAPTKYAPVCRATRCSRWRPPRKTVASASRASSTRHERASMSGVVGAAGELASAVRAGSQSARELVEEHLAVVDAHDGELNACNVVTTEWAHATADAVDASVARGDDPGPLAGVP